MAQHVAPTTALREPLELPVVGQPRERCDASRNRLRILAAARELLIRNGAEGLSMNAIAAAAGVGKGTIFRRFGDRDGLLMALLDEDTIALQDGFLSGPPPLGPGAPAGERLEAFVVAWVRFVLAHLELLLAAEQGHIPSASPALAACSLHVATLLAEIDPTLDGPVLAAIILNSTSPRLIRRISEDLAPTADTLERSALALLRGVTRR